MKSAKNYISLFLLLVVLTACSTSQPPETVAALSTVVTQVVEVPVTPTPSLVPEGGQVVWAIVEEPRILNPILAADPTSKELADALFLGLVGPHPTTGQLQGELAQSWEFSEDSRRITVHLRDNLLWSDGEPITAWDVKFTFEAIVSEAVTSPLRRIFTNVDSVRVLDNQRVQMRLVEPDCTLLTNFTFGILPAHRYAADFSDVMTNPENFSPAVSSGPLKFSAWERGKSIALIRNDRYAFGAPHLKGVTFGIFQDRDAAVAAFLSGEVDILKLESTELSAIEGAIARGEPYALKRVLSDGYVFLGLNMADPEQPELGWVDADEDGERDVGEIPNSRQTPHPIFGDRLVRQAVAHAIDSRRIINQVVLGEAVQIPSNVLPSIRWAFDEDLIPYGYDPETARELLQEAGWIDGNDDGTREKEGRELRTAILVNVENEQRVRIAEMVSEDLTAVGFDTTLQIVDWPSVLWDQLGQRFDIVVSEWAALGFDPHDARLWSASTDDPADGTNFVSFYDAVVEREFNAAETQSGCAPEMRSMRYRNIQRRVHEQAPYVFLYVPFEHIAWNTRLHGFNPGSWSLNHDFEDWYLQSGTDS